MYKYYWHTLSVYQYTLLDSISLWCLGPGWLGQYYKHTFCTLNASVHTETTCVATNSTQGAAWRTNSLEMESNNKLFNLGENGYHEQLYSLKRKSCVFVYGQRFEDKTWLLLPCRPTLRALVKQFEVTCGAAPTPHGEYIDTGSQIGTWNSPAGCDSLGGDAAVPWEAEQLPGEGLFLKGSSFPDFYLLFLFLNLSRWS